MNANQRLIHFARCALVVVIVLITTLSSQQISYAAGICYVSASASGADNGASWADAYTDLRSALFSENCTEIWVAAGTYTPISWVNRETSFTLKNGVAIYGGFNGTETLRTQRDPEANVTILSGELGAAGIDNNSYHVVNAIYVDSSAVLDGFTITGGNANNTQDSGFYSRGSGIYIYVGDPTLANLIVQGNHATGGGAIYYGDTDSRGLSPTLTNVVFRDNHGGVGGGMANDNSSPRLLNVTFEDNTAVAGGGMANYFGSDPVLNNVTFSGNTATNTGGAIHNYNGGSPKLVNATFYGNTAAVTGGGMYNYLSNPRLTNVTFRGNSAGAGGGIYSDNGSQPVIKNSVFWGNGTELVNTGSSEAQIYDSLVQGGCPTGALCTNILATDPLLGPLENNGGFTKTMALDAGSPAIDAGNNSTCAAVDQRGVKRPQGKACDLGGYEYAPPNRPYRMDLPILLK